MSYDNITVQSDPTEGRDAIADEVSRAVEQMRSQDFDASGDTLRTLLSAVRDKAWNGKELQGVFALDDGREIPAPPTPLLVKLLAKHPDVIPFVLDHYLMSGSEGGTGELLIAEESRDRSEKIKAEKMERLLADVGYSPTGLKDSEKQIAFAHQYDALKSELLEELFVYSQQVISFDRSKEIRDSIGRLLHA